MNTRMNSNNLDNISNEIYKMKRKEVTTASND